MKTRFFAITACAAFVSACDGRTPTTPLAAPEQPPPAAPTEGTAAKPAEAPAESHAGVPPGVGMRFAFDNEPRDATWAQPLESLVVSVVKTAPQVTLVSVECKTTICKIVVSHPPGRIAATWGQTFSGKLGAAFPDKPYRGTFMYDQALDMKVSTTYFTRNGFGEHHADGTPRRKRSLPPPPDPEGQLPSTGD